jgi:hypothetical protein
MTAFIYLLTLILPLATILLVFAIRGWSAIQQAKARLANEDEYRRIAEKAAGAQADTANALTAIQASMSEVQARLTAVEKILKDVG